LIASEQDGGEIKERRVLVFRAETGNAGRGTGVKVVSVIGFGLEKGSQVGPRGIRIILFNFFPGAFGLIPLAQAGMARTDLDLGEGGFGPLGVEEQKPVVFHQGFIELFLLAEVRGKDE
jgi:hypothetical protein